MGWGRAWGASGDVRWSHHAPFVCVTQTGAGAVPGSRCCRQRMGQCPGTAPGTGLAERGVNAPLPGASLPLGGGAQSSAHGSQPLPGPGCCTVQSPLRNQCPKEQCGLHLPRGGGGRRDNGCTRAWPCSSQHRCPMTGREFSRPLPAHRILAPGSEAQGRRWDGAVSLCTGSCLDEDGDLWLRRGCMSHRSSPGPRQMVLRTGRGLSQVTAGTDEESCTLLSASQPRAEPAKGRRDLWSAPICHRYLPQGRPSPW